jgi:lysophospholipase L1-like esterase
VVAAATTGALALFTIGETYALITAGVVAAAAIVIAFTATVRLGRAVLVLLIAAVIGSVTVGAFGAVQILAAVAGDQSGPVDPPDPDALASAEAKIDAEAPASFRVELTEIELNAVLQDALAETDTPFQRITVDILNHVGEPGLVGFVGDFKNGRLTVTGKLTVSTRGGRLELDLLEADVGLFTMPGIARDAVEDMIARVADLNRALADEGADVQRVVVGDDRIVVTGTTVDPAGIDASTLLTAFGDLTAIGTTTVDQQPYAPGVDAATAAGDPYYVALGDSLAAAVGVPGFAEGYVSQLHQILSEQDGIAYGMRNFGTIGETSGTIVLGGQLEDALGFGEAHDVAYVTIDVGANDLLGHLASAACRVNVSDPECSDRINASIDAYTENIDQVLASLADGFPDATIVMLLAYNPFSFGFESSVEFEAQSNEVIGRLNAVARAAADRSGVVVADGFTPMRGTATATTHMTDDPPDIHPNTLGYDILTAAILDALATSRR